MDEYKQTFSVININRHLHSSNLADLALMFMLKIATTKLTRDFGKVVEKEYQQHCSHKLKE